MSGNLDNQPQNIDALCFRLWEAAKEAVEPFGDMRYYPSSDDDDTACAAMRTELEAILAKHPSKG